MNLTPCFAMLAAAALVLFPGRRAAAYSSPAATTDVRVTSDWPDTELIRNLGTSFGTGYVGGRAASITTVHLEELCRAPCKTALQTEGTYYVDAPGMHTREFGLPAERKNLKVQVSGASAVPLVLSGWGTLLGGTTAVLGGLFWALLGGEDWKGEAKDTSTYQTMTLVGGVVMVAGIVGLVALPRTHVEADDGTRLDARATPKSTPTVRFTGSGLTF